MYMTGKTHQILGITAGVSWFLLANSARYEPATFAAVAVGAHLAALLPDIDTAAAEIWHTIPFGDEVGKVATSFLEHRNISHSLLGFALAGWGMWALLGLFPAYWGIDRQIVWVACLIAYGSHLLADAVTVEGIPLLFPYQKMIGIPPKPFEGIRIVSGKWFENLVIFPAINIVLIIMIISQWATIKLILLK